MVEAVNKLGPKRNFVSPLDLIEEAILLGDCFTFVVAPQQDDLTWIPHFESEKEADDLAALLAAVHVISQEKISLIFRND